MTYNELKKHVTHLGFDDTINDDALLSTATERALSLLFIDLPQIATAKIYVSAPMLTNVYKTVKHRGGQTEEVEITADAFSFYPHGEGRCMLLEDVVVGRVNFTAASGFVKKKITNGKVTLRFEGNNDYVVTAVAGFMGAFDTEKDIPEYGGFRLISLGDYIGDFRTLAALPHYPDATPIPEATVFGDSLRLPYSFDGEIAIDYYRTPTFIRGVDGLIDLPLGAEPLLPLLVASYIWLDDEPEKAQYYMALYRDAAASILRAERYTATGKYVTNGWA